jgi:LmbE family N-acetylglucosaminyl deacetylase
MLTSYSGKKVLVLAPHTDDGELGCGGTIAKLASEGAEIYYMVFSSCSRSLPVGLAPDTLEKEVANATVILGIPNERLILLDYDVRTFNTYRQEILEDMIRFRNEHKPDLVFLPSKTDIHQDHEVISKEGIRAFKDINILGYEMPWNNLSFNTSCFSKLTEATIQKKIEALREYKSQNHRPYFNEVFIRSLAYTRGVQIGADYAEAFEVIRWIWN